MRLEARGHEVRRFDILLGHNIALPIDPEPCDAVIHLAAMAAPKLCDESPAQAFSINVNGTLQVLKFALASGAKKFVFASSAHVYGVGPRYLPTDETHPLSLGNTYTTTKILGEELCRLYWENHGLPYTILRLFNAYGPGQGPGYFIPDMIQKAKSPKPWLSGADTTKDWVYIDDVARAFALAVESPYVGALNIGSGVSVKLGIVASLIGGFTFLPGGKPTHMRADITRAQRILGWVPTTGVQDGITRIKLERS